MLPAALRLGPVHLVVTDLERSVAFYERSIGLRTRDRAGERAALGAGAQDLLVLHEEPAAQRAGRHAGLYHFALLHPSRLELARATQRLIDTRTAVSGASDHGISEAVYLSDPDGNGIELAADRSRERWGDLSDPATVGPMPLDLAGLLGEAGDQPAPAQADRGLRVGHLHLHVGDIEQALAFYRDAVGFEVMTRFPSAAFVASGGYHHHLGLNTWRGQGVAAAPADAVGLRRWTIVIDPEALAELGQRLEGAAVEVGQNEEGLLAADPWQNKVLFTSGAAA